MTRLIITAGLAWLILAAVIGVAVGKAMKVMGR